MKKLITIAASLLIATGIAGCGDKTQNAANKDSAGETFNVCWSHYIGWEPWGYADAAGILAKHAKAEGIDIKLTLINDYIESINLYTAGQYDACTMTNMDALTIPAVGGIDSQAIIAGDFSNGNDGIIARDVTSVAGLRGRTINLVELSVSHYLLARALDMNGLKESDVKLINTSDADIAALFTSDPKGIAVTWNPPLMEAKKAPNAKVIFDSSKIPGEILDLMVVKTDASDKLKRALVATWYEVMQLVKAEDPAAMDWIAESSGTDVAGVKAQLATTNMFWTAAQAKQHISSGRLLRVMNDVRRFSFNHGLFGDSAQSPDFVGIQLDDGSVLGAKDNVKLRFTSKYLGN